MKIKNIIGICLLPVLLSGCSFTGKEKINSDPSEYNKVLKQFLDDKDVHSEMYIFPEKIDVSKADKFESRIRDGIFGNDYFMYLSTKYESDTFEQEINRLKDIKCTYVDGTVKTIIHLEEESLFVTIYKDNRFEYVTFDEEELKVTYVFNQLYHTEEKLENIVVPFEFDDGGNSYNMYYRYEGDVGYYITDDK